MSDTDEQQEVATPMPYWMTPEFHNKVETLPRVQTGADGTKVLRVSFKYFKLDGEDLKEATIPQDLSIPAQWDSAASDPLAAKARSILGNAL